MLSPACEVLGLCLNASGNKVVCLQARLLMEKAHAISEKWGKAPVTIAGDFNSTPNVISYILFHVFRIHQVLAKCYHFPKYRWTLEKKMAPVFMLFSKLGTDAIY